MKSINNIYEKVTGFLKKNWLSVFSLLLAVFSLYWNTSLSKQLKKIDKKYAIENTLGALQAEIAANNYCLMEEYKLKVFVLSIAKSNPDFYLKLIKKYPIFPPTLSKDVYVANCNKLGNIEPKLAYNIIYHYNMQNLLNARYKHPTQNDKTLEKLFYLRLVLGLLRNGASVSILIEKEISDSGIDIEKLSGGKASLESLERKIDLWQSVIDETIKYYRKIQEEKESVVEQTDIKSKLTPEQELQLSLFYMKLKEILQQITGKNFFDMK